MKAAYFQIIGVLMLVSCKTSKALVCDDVKIELKQKAFLGDGEQQYELFLPKLTSSASMLSLQIENASLIHYASADGKVVKANFQTGEITIPLSPPIPRSNTTLDINRRI